VRFWKAVDGSANNKRYGAWVRNGKDLVLMENVKLQRAPGSDNCTYAKGTVELDDTAELFVPLNIE
jgi:hypothetical protein